MLALYGVVGLLIVLVASMMIIGLSGGRINRTASHPIGLYWIVEKEPEVGDYVLFCIPVERSELPPIDMIYVTPCTADYEGTPLLKRIDQILSDGRYYVKGDQSKSLDSRVFGPIHRREVMGVFEPILAVTAMPL